MANHKTSLAIIFKDYILCLQFDYETRRLLTKLGYILALQYYYYYYYGILYRDEYVFVCIAGDKCWITLPYQTQNR